MAFDELTALHSPFGSIGRIGPGLLLAQRSFRHRPIHGLPCLVQTFPFIVVEQPLRPQFLKDARLGPLLKASMSTAARTDTCGIECFPLAPCSQPIKNGIHRFAVVHPRTMIP
jgi:hypothetical protein